MIHQMKKTKQKNVQNIAVWSIDNSQVKNYFTVDLAWKKAV